MEQQAEKVLHMPDLFFVKWCEEHYAINKGVYNTIDCWFYEQGLLQIVERRKAILSFSHYIHEVEASGKRMKFGPGGLTARLAQFWEERMRQFRQKVI